MSDPMFGGPPPSIAASESIVARRASGDFRWRYEDGLALIALAECGRRRARPDFTSYVAEALRGLILPSGGIKGYRVEDWNLDQIKPGLLLFDFRDSLGPGLADHGRALLMSQLERQPRSPSGAFWHKGIYPNQLWLDGLYMAAPFYLRSSLESGREVGVADVLLQFRLAEEHCSEAAAGMAAGKVPDRAGRAEGLLKHAWNEGSAEAWADPTTGRSPNFWGRAMGWFLMAEVDCLSLLPPAHPGRSQLEASLRRLCAAVIGVADPATGLWWQVLDQGGRKGNYLETSASAMFIYALMKASSLAVLEGAEERAALAAASRAWASLLSTRVSRGEDGLFSLGGICQVAGLGGMPYRDGSWDYYLSEPVVRDDFKGLGPFVLAALEMEDASARRA